jgi:hypothetical protein
MCGMTDSLPDANASPLDLPPFMEPGGFVQQRQRLVAVGQKR